MLEVQEKKLKQAVAMLEVLGTKFKVITPDGVEYGDLEIKPPKPASKGRNLPRYPRGEVRDLFMPFLVGMKAGQAKVIECKNHDARVVARDLAAYSANHFGAGSLSCHTDRESNIVQVLALADLG